MDKYYRLEVEDLGEHKVIKKKDGSMIFTKKEESEPHNKRVRKSMMKFINQVIDEDEFLITL